MAMKSYTVTMTGSAVQISTTRQPFHEMRIESEAGNAIVYFGASTVSSSDYAGSVLANTATITNAVVIGPFSGEYNSDISEWYFSGTNGQKIHICLIT